MVDLSDICGDTPMRASFVKKRAKAQEKLDKATESYHIKALPLQAEVAMYDKMIAAIDEKNMGQPFVRSEGESAEEFAADLTETEAAPAEEAANNGQAEIPPFLRDKGAA